MPKISHLAQFSVKGGIKGGVHHPFTENMDVTGQTPWLIQQYCSSHQTQQIKCQSAPRHFCLHVKLWVNGWQSHNKPCWSGLNGAWLLSSLYSLSYHFNNAILRKGPDEPFLLSIENHSGQSSAQGAILSPMAVGRMGSVSRREVFVISCWVVLHGQAGL